MGETLRLGFGCNAAVKMMRFPPTTAWGARFIAPADLLASRQDLQAADDTQKAELIAWLNGTPEGTGAIGKAQAYSRANGIGLGYSPVADSRSNAIVELYRDDTGVIFGSPQSSYGYVYVAGWLHAHAVEAAPAAAA